MSSRSKRKEADEYQLLKHYPLSPIGYPLYPILNTKELSIVMENISEGDTVEMTIMRFISSYFGQVRRQYTVRLKAQTTKDRI
jgi:hypothetical protein